ncbi:unnamed protein product [Calicophoron daubneyi]|uniref:Uncharacterized protein n=1 Tax=Calicophoron daubneyi TaxID=300641 RepID=A0AAV2TJH1_CALDB
MPLKSFNAPDVEKELLTVTASFTCDARGKGPCRESGTTTICGQESQYTPDDPYVELRGDFFCGRGRTEVHTIIAKRDTVYRIKTPVGYSFCDPDMSD